MRNPGERAKKFIRRKRSMAYRFSRSHSIENRRRHKQFRSPITHRDRLARPNQFNVTNTIRKPAPPDSISAGFLPLFPAIARGGGNEAASRPRPPPPPP